LLTELQTRATTSSTGGAGYSPPFLERHRNCVLSDRVRVDNWCLLFLTLRRRS
jgi:hypothetical protein